MLPNDTLSSAPVFAPFIQSKVATTKRTDYELGGVAVGDPSGGLSAQLWSARYVGGQIVVEDAAGAQGFALTAAGVTKLSLAFDQNMRVNLAYQTAAGTYLRWFDTSINDFAITLFADARNPALTLDERRDELLNNSDVIFAYQKADGGLYYRQQRDRYDVEYLLRADTGAAQLIAVATNKAYRLQFAFTGVMP